MRALLFLASILFATALMVAGARVPSATDPAPGLAETAPAGAHDVASPTGTPGRFFRWRDGTGRIHYESRRPAGPVVAEEIRFLRPPPARGPVATPDGAGSGADLFAGHADPRSVYSVDGITALMGEVHDTAELLDARLRQVESMKRLMKGGAR